MPSPPTRLLTEVIRQAPVQRSLNIGREVGSARWIVSADESAELDRGLLFQVSHLDDTKARLLAGSGPVVTGEGPSGSTPESSVATQQRRQCVVVAALRRGQEI